MNEENINSKTRIDGVFSFLMKFFFYYGLVCFVPYIILKGSNISFENLDFNALKSITWIVIFVLAVLFAMDIIGMYSSFLDRISRLITLIFTVIGAITSIILFIITRRDWESEFSSVIILTTILIIVYGFLGWFFIRAEHGLTPKKQSPLYNTSLWALLICGMFFLIEYFLSGAILIGMFIGFGSYPFIIIFLGHPKVTPHIKPRKIVNPYKRTTFYNFIIDMIKAVAILITVFAIIYDGTVVLYPKETIINEYAWIRNLAIVAIFAALGMAVIVRIQEKFYGLLVLVLLYLCCIIQYILVNTFYIHYWWIIAPINGFTLAGVYFFIEQKIYKSANVGVMTGSLYMLLLIIISVAVLLRADHLIDDVIENTKLTISLLGLTYIIGYIREAPKQKSLRISI